VRGNQINSKMLSSDDARESLDLFLAEAIDYLQALNSGLPGLKKTADDKSRLENVNYLFRASRSIKGMAGMMNFRKIKLLAQKMESVFDNIRQGRSNITEELTGALLECGDILTSLIACVSQAEPETESADIDDILFRLDAFSGSVPPAGDDAGTSDAVSEATRILKAVQSVRVDLSRLDNLSNMVDELACVKANLARLAGRFSALSRTRNLRYAFEDAIMNIERLKAELTAKNVSGAEKAIKTVECVLGSLSYFQDGLKEHYEGGNDVIEIDAAVSKLGKIIRGLHAGISEIRIVPIAGLFGHIDREARDLAESRGGRISLDIMGGDTRIDIKLVEELEKPLMRIVGNAVEHELESPRAGSCSCARSIALNAYRDGAWVRIDIVDAGREFPVSEKVPDFAGFHAMVEGVKNSVEELNGSLYVAGEDNAGTTYSIKIPRTMAIISALLARVAGTIYLIPLESVVEAVKIPVEQINNVEGRPSVKFHDALLSVAELSLAGVEKRSVPKNAWTIVVVASGDRKFGIRVDELFGREEIVLKPLAKEFKKVEGISGTAVLSDGTIGLIIDIQAFVELLESK